MQACWPQHCFLCYTVCVVTFYRFFWWSLGQLSCTYQFFLEEVQRSERKNHSRKSPFFSTHGMYTVLCVNFTLVFLPIIHASTFFFLLDSVWTDVFSWNQYIYVLLSAFLLCSLPPLYNKNHTAVEMRALGNDMMIWSTKHFPVGSLKHSDALMYRELLISLSLTCCT